MVQKKFIFILGPTATGKTDLAVNLCRRLKAPLLNLDSIQMYEGLDIGSAKPSSRELEGLDHFLFSAAKYPDLLDASQVYNQVINVVDNSPNEYFVFCGGSGFYLQSLEKGMFQVETIDPQIREELQSRVEREGGDKLYAEWEAIDPEAAGKTSGNDHYRIIRALEIYKAFGKTLSELRQSMEGEAGGLQALGKLFKFGIEWKKEDLNNRIKQRIEKMFSQGFIEEVKSLRDQCEDHWKPLQSVGYKEVIDYLNSDRNSEEEELKELISIRTRQLAKKQRTWFKKQQDIAWISGHVSLEKQERFVLEKINFGDHP